MMAVTSIYGVDILQDNVKECRKRLFEIWDKEYTANCKGECRYECREAARFILERNILCVNALTLKKVNESGEDTDAPIIFSEWVFTGKSSIKRSDYRLDVLMRENPDEANYQQQMTLFAGDEDNMKTGWKTRTILTKAFQNPSGNIPLYMTGGFRKLTNDNNKTPFIPSGVLFGFFQIFSN